MIGLPMKIIASQTNRLKYNVFQISVFVKTKNVKLSVSKFIFLGQQRHVIT